MISWRASRGMNKVSLAYVAPRLIAGSALAGFGLAFGRDIYRGAKKSILLIAIIFLAAASLFGSFLSGLWLARNQRHIAARLLLLLLAFPIFCISVVGLFLSISVFSVILVPIVQAFAGDTPESSALIVLALRTFDFEFCMVSNIADAMSISLGHDACAAPSQALAGC